MSKSCLRRASGTAILRRSYTLLALAACLPAYAAGQIGLSSDSGLNPPPPTAPASVARTDLGRATVRAIRLTEPLELDGQLEEAVYRDNLPIDGFIQTIPDEGQPVSERTEAWLMYDDENIYLTCRCWDSAPPSEWTANEMRRDTDGLRENDFFGALYDTFHDGRNGFNLYANWLGARNDQWVTDEAPNNDWNPVWSVRGGQFDGGWTIEMAIPFKSLRYVSGSDQTWGVQIRRAIRRKNEYAHVAFVQASTGGRQSINRVAAAANLTGLDLPPAGKNIEIKPYATSSLTSDLTRTPRISNDVDGDLGMDVKLGITANITADLTYNTDFAQVEVDERQVNLSRFSLSFPEKREFFLEGQGTFDFGRGTRGGGGGAAPTLFYSRRIGLSGSAPVPILGGGRVTGKAGPLGFGVMNVQTERIAGVTPATNFSVVRVKSDVLRRSTIGALFTHRTRSATVDASNQAYGVDANFGFGQAVSLGGFYAQAQTEGLGEAKASYLGRASYDGDTYGLTGEYVVVEDAFNPGIGLVRRDDFRRYATSARYSPRPRGIEWLRQYTLDAGYQRIESLVLGELETEVWDAGFNLEFENSDMASLRGALNVERLDAPLRVSSTVSVPAGDYEFNSLTLQYTFGGQRRASGSASLEVGEFYDGTITSIQVQRGRIAVLDRLSVLPSISYNDVRLPAGDFNTTVVGVRADYAFTPLMFVGGLIQFDSDSDSFSSNLRFRWEYAPGSEFFAVYTDERSTLGSGIPDLRNRAFVLKINRLLRF